VGSAGARAPASPGKSPSCPRAPLRSFSRRGYAKGGVVSRRGTSVPLAGGGAAVALRPRRAAVGFRRVRCFCLSGFLLYLDVPGRCACRGGVARTANAVRRIPGSNLYYSHAQYVCVQSIFAVALCRKVWYSVHVD
jgi:hypothetical protein